MSASTTPLYRRLLLVVLASSCAAGIGLGFLQARELSAMQRRVLQQRQTVRELRQSIVRQRMLAAKASAVAAVNRSRSNLVPNSGDSGFDQRLRYLVRRVYRLHHWIEQHPADNVPDLAYASDGSWFEAAVYLQHFTDEELQNASWNLRRQAQFNFLFLAASALQDYEAHSGGWLPKSMQDLAPYFVAPITDAMLARFEITARGRAENTPADEPVFSERLPADALDQAELTTVDHVPVRIAGGPNEDPHMARERADTKAIFSAIAAFRRAHAGQSPRQASDLRPYVKNPSMLDALTLDPGGDGFTKTAEAGQK